MLTEGYSILAVIEDDKTCAAVYALLEKDQKYRLCRITADFHKAGKELQHHAMDAVIIFMEHLSPSAKAWIKNTIEKSAVPVLVSTADKISARELGVEETMFRTCSFASGTPMSIVSEINIKIRVLAQNKKKMPAPQQHKVRNVDINIVNRILSGTINGDNYAKPEKLIAIGASMGGVEAVTKVLSMLPAQMPGIVVTQHMPPGFTSMFAKSIKDVCELKVQEAVDCGVIEPGTIYIAPGGKHLTVKAGENGGYITRLRLGERVEGHIPSVTTLFESVAAAAGKHAMGIILTGMGGDGAVGLLKMRQAGAFTVGQDEASSLVYGMPRVAFELGAVSKQVPLEQIPRNMITYANR